MTSSAETELIWSSGSHTMRDFVEAFQGSLPVLVRTTAGWAGFDEGMHQIGSGEVYYVSDIQRQKRFVVQPEKSSCYLSIPTEYPVKVQIFQEGSKKVGPPVPVKDVFDVISQRSTPVRLKFENNQPVSFQIGADLGSTAKLGVLTVIQTYEEKYLLANTIYGRSIYLHSHGIPVYLPIEFATAGALKVGGAEALRLWMKEVADIMKTIKRTPVRMCQELILFSERPSGGEYDYIRLTDLSTFNEKDTIYQAVIIKRQNPYDLDPERPKLPGPKRQASAHMGPSNHSKFMALPRFPPPSPVQPGPVGRTTSDSSKCSNQPVPYDGTTPPTPARPIRAAKGPSRPVQPYSSAGSCPGGSILNQGGPPPEPPTPGVVYERLGPTDPGSEGIYESLSEIPSHEDFGKLTIEQVVGCLRLLRLGHHADAFRARFVDGMMAQCLTEQMLEKEFEFRSFEAIQFVMFAKKGWRPK